VRNREQIEARVRELLGQVLDVPSESIGPELSQALTPSWTSLTHLMLMSQIEGEFGVFLSNQEIRDLTSFAQIVETLAQRQSPSV
jgi:acyl carrier protein